MSEADSEIILSVEETPKGGFVVRALGRWTFTELDYLDALRGPARNHVSRRRS